MVEDAVYLRGARGEGQLETLQKEGALLEGQTVVSPDVFISVGSTFLPQQKTFVAGVEQYLRDNGLAPRVMGDTDINSQGQPLKNILDVMKQCSGTVVIAFERKYLQEGAEKRGSSVERILKSEKLPTVWNHIEAAQAYLLGHPLLVIAEQDLYCEGLLEDKYDWYVQWLPLDPSVLNDRQVKGVFADWKRRVEKYHEAKQRSGSEATTEIDPGKLTISQLFGSLTAGQLWGVIGAIFTILSVTAVAAYNLGAFLTGG